MCHSICIDKNIAVATYIKVTVLTYILYIHHVHIIHVLRMYVKFILYWTLHSGKATQESNLQYPVPTMGLICNADTVNGTDTVGIGIDRFKHHWKYPSNSHRCWNPMALYIWNKSVGGVSVPCFTFELSMFPQILLDGDGRGGNHCQPKLVAGELPIALVWGGRRKKSLRNDSSIFSQKIIADTFWHLSKRFGRFGVLCSPQAALEHVTFGFWLRAQSDRLPMAARLRSVVQAGSEISRPFRMHEKKNIFFPY